RRVGPDRVVQRLFGYQKVRPFDEIAQHVPGLGPERDLDTSPPQTVAGEVDAKAGEGNLPTTSERRGRRGIAHEEKGTIREMSEECQPNVRTGGAGNCEGHRGTNHGRAARNERSAANR